MQSLAISFVFLVLAGILLGMLFRKALPQTHSNKDARTRFGSASGSSRP
jgi:hypothetical protein